MPQCWRALLEQIQRKYFRTLSLSCPLIYHIPDHNKSCLESNATRTSLCFLLTAASEQGLWPRIGWQRSCDQIMSKFSLVFTISSGQIENFSVKFSCLQLLQMLFFFFSLSMMLCKHMHMLHALQSSFSFFSLITRTLLGYTCRPLLKKATLERMKRHSIPPWEKWSHPSSRCLMTTSYFALGLNKASN